MQPANLPGEFDKNFWSGANQGRVGNWKSGDTDFIPGFQD
jgi:hypothetical protein